MPDIPKSTEQWLAEKRQKLSRLSPQEAANEAEQGALLVDTRPLEKKLASGIIPGARQIRLDILQWRIDEDHINPNKRIILICDHGYSSSAAAAELVDLGLDATDVDGGFQAWIEAGLPCVSPNVLHKFGARMIRFADRFNSFSTSINPYVAKKP